MVMAQKKFLEINISCNPECELKLLDLCHLFRIKLDFFNFITTRIYSTFQSCYSHFEQCLRYRHKKKKKVLDTFSIESISFAT